MGAAGRETVAHANLAGGISDTFLEEVQFHMSHYSPESVTELLTTVAATHEPWVYLDELAKVHDSNFYKAKNLLACLEPKVIAEVFGVPMLLWLAAQRVGSNIQDALLEECKSAHGIDTVLFKKACAWSWQRHMRSDAASLFPVHDFLTSMTESESLQALNLAGILTDRSTGDWSSRSSSRLVRYGIIPLQTNSEYTCGYARGWNTTVWPGERYEMYLDAPTGFALTYRDRPQAMVGFCVDSGELLVTQIQGIQPKRVDSENNEIGTMPVRGLHGLDWVNSLIDIAESVADQHGIDMVCIQAARHNRWTKVQQGEQAPHVTVEQILNKYDIPAATRGYKQGEDGNWRKSIIN